MYTYDELTFYVTAANISGIMEQKGDIAISDDNELTNFIGKQYGLYKEALDLCEKSTEYPYWPDWISAALLKEYGE